MIVTKTHGEMGTKNGDNLVPSSAQGCLEYRLHSLTDSPFTWILLRNPTCIRQMEHTPPYCGNGDYIHSQSEIDIVWNPRTM